MILALLVSGLLRGFNLAGAPEISFRLSADATSFRYDGASYALSPSCTPRAFGYLCKVPLLSYEEKQGRHSVIACKSSGTVCGGTLTEAKVSCICTYENGDCPGELFPDPPMVAPYDLVATAVSESEIDLVWTETGCNVDQYIIERAPTSSGPWTEIGRVP